MQLAMLGRRAHGRKGDEWGAPLQSHGVKLLRSDLHLSKAFSVGL